MYRLNDIKQSPNKLAEHYTDFDVANKLLLTGHSHQAWPNVAKVGHIEAYNDAALLLDKKWERAYVKSEKVKQGYKRILNDKTGNIALASNTHDVVLKFLSALPLKLKPKILTTDGEFHTIRRQLARLSEENINIDKISVDDHYSIAERLIEKLDRSYAAVMISAVFFQNSSILQNLSEIAKRCNELEIPLLVDSYHALNAIPFTIDDNNLENAFIVGGGYKYMQLGEGNCFLRFPKDCDMRPVITGWFSEFSTIGDKKSDKVVYGEGDDLFAGSTFDPVSHYRAAKVFDFFEKNGLSPEFLREVSLYQVDLLRNRFIEAEIDPKIADYHKHIRKEHIAGFFTVITKHAEELNTKLFEKDIYTDFRGDNLRFGPAPYLSDSQLHKTMDIFIDILKKI